MSDHDLVQQAYWDSVASNNKVINDNNLPFPAVRERELFFKFAGFKEGNSILEIGCGTGRYTFSLLRMGCKVYATDISKKSIEILKESTKEEKLDENLVVEENTFEDTGKCQKLFNKFDYVIFVGVIHHLNPRKKKIIFANAVDSVKKGGRIVALEPNPLNPLYYCLYLWRALAKIKGRNRWSTEKSFLKTSSFSLNVLFKRAGLKNIKMKKYAWLPSLFANNFPPILKFNDALNRIPILKEMSAFNWISGEKH